MYAIVLSLLLPAMALAQTIVNPCNGVDRGFVPDPNDATCKSYWSCINGAGQKQSCATGRVFDRVQSACIVQNATFVCPEPLCAAGSTGIKHKPFPNDCDKYYTCANGNLFERKCGPGMKFDYIAGDCDTELKADCLVCPPEVPAKLVRYPDKKNCNAYYLCANGQYQKRL